MKQLFKTQDLEGLFQNEKMDVTQMDYLRGGDGPMGDQPVLDDPPILPPPTPDLG